MSAEDRGRGRRLAGAALAIVLASVLAACAGPGQEPGPDTSGEPGRDTSGEPGRDHAGERGQDHAGQPVLITTSSVGCLELDATVAEAARDCQVVADTTIHLEGMPQRALWVDVGAGRVLAEIVEDRVWRISVAEAGPVTADSVGVGTPLRDLVAYPDPRISAGEGQYFLTTPAQCGLSFGIRGLPFGEGPWSAEEMAAMPDSVRVDRILVTGVC